MLQDLSDLLVLWSIYLLFAQGMSLVWGSIGILNFAHGAIFMFSAFTGYLVSQELRLGLLGMTVLGTCVGAGLSAAMHVLVVEPILRRSANAAAAELRALIASVGIAAVLLTVAQASTRSVPFGLGRMEEATSVHSFGSVRLSLIQLLIIGAGLVVTTCMVWWLRTAKSGLALQAIGLDPETASLMGVRRTRLAVTAMAVAGGLAGLAAVLLTYHLGSIAAESGDAMVLKAFSAIVLGGVGHAYAVIAGTLLLAAAETAVLTYTSGTWVDAVSYGLIFVVLLVRPQGLLGRAEVRRT
ncbi:branched-chain amino acid ABC transporter permease [Streptomyces chartreusis]